MVAVAAVSPICDVLALWGRDGWLTPPLAPIVAAAAPVVARARTVQLTVAAQGPGLTPFYDGIFDSVDGAALVMAGAASADAVWGEILSTAFAAAGGTCVLVDGFGRDVPEVTRLGLPVYARGVSAVGPRGRVHVVAIDVDVAVDGVTISPGDTIVADGTGCVRVRASEHDAVLAAARRYADAEAAVVAAVRGGAPLGAAYRDKSAVVEALTAERDGSAFA